MLCFNLFLFNLGMIPTSNKRHVTNSWEDGTWTTLKHCALQEAHWGPNLLHRPFLHHSPLGGGSSVFSHFEVGSSRRFWICRKINLNEMPPEFSGKKQKQHQDLKWRYYHIWISSLKKDLSKDLKRSQIHKSQKVTVSKAPTFARLGAHQPQRPHLLRALVQRCGAHRHAGLHRGLRGSHAQRDLHATQQADELTRICWAQNVGIAC